MYRLLILFFSVLSIFLTTPNLYAKRSIPDDNLGYPVFVILDNGETGSGFFLNDTAATYFITARHVLFNCKEKCRLKGKSATLTSYGRDPNDSTKNVFVLNLLEIHGKGNIYYHQKYDTAAIKIASEIPNSESIIKVTQGVKGKSKAKSGIVAVAISNVKLFKEVLIANDVFIFGYPSSIGIKNIPQIDYERPLLRKGIVAGLNYKKRSIIIDAAAYGGNSGGPVIETEFEGLGYRLRLIGLISEYIPFAHKLPSNEQVTVTNSGYAVVTPADFILELIGR